jgi:hypothetical protein
MLTLGANVYDTWYRSGEEAPGAVASSLLGGRREVVRPARFERATYRFVVCRSIQLS